MRAAPIKHEEIKESQEPHYGEEEEDFYEGKHAESINDLISAANRLQEKKDSLAARFQAAPAKPKKRSALASILAEAQDDGEEDFSVLKKR